VQFITLAERFHRTLAEAADKTRAWAIVESIKSQMDRVRHLSIRHFATQKRVAQHTAIVDALAERNIALAETAMREHLTGILIDFPAIAANQPTFFCESQ